MAEELENNEKVNQPKHYNSLNAKCEVCEHQVECITVVREMNFNLGNAIKYIWRCEDKGETINDLKKAMWYLQDEIDKRNKKDVPLVTIYNKKYQV